MKVENETKEKILVSAKNEFMEKGYMRASLRNICKNAGVTTGAVYFFFKDKEDLFASLVEEPLNKLYYIMNKHYEAELHQLDGCSVEKTDSIWVVVEDFADDLEAAKQMIHYMYKYYDEFQLLLTKSQGSRFENFIDQFVEISEKHYRIICDKVCTKMKQEKIDDDIIHWFAHMNVDMFIHMLTHQRSEDEAIKHMTVIIKYLFVGWQGMFQ